MMSKGLDAGSRRGVRMEPWLTAGKAEAAQVAILAGIDEAGFGPLLGPLVVSCSAFSVPPELLGADLWQTFRRSVGKTRKHLQGRLLIADSKKAYKRGEDTPVSRASPACAGPGSCPQSEGETPSTRGLGHLERTVLGVLQCLGKEPAHLTELLVALCPDCLPRLQEYPWHQKMPQCDLRHGPADGKIASRVFANDLEARGAKLVLLRSCCLDVAHYNTLVSRVKNKAQVLFIAVTQLMQSLLDGFSDDVIQIQVDRQGGRAHYRENLLRSFPGVDLRIVQEGDRTSTYELRTGGRLVRLSFEVEADDLHLPVALASMVSKYVRERLMECMNEYFLGMSADLKPTAGYWKDGQRFVEDLRRHLPHVAIDSHKLIRSR
jgi:ribonuclease HII